MTTPTCAEEILLQVNINRDENGTQQNWTLQLMPGDIVFVIGANGAGKSSLLNFLRRSPSSATKLVSITAHRQTWFETGAIGMTPASRQSFEQTNNTQERQQKARYTEWDPSSRVGAVLFDLVNSEAQDSQDLAELVRNNAAPAVIDLAKKKETPLQKINRILRTANIAVEIQVEGIARVTASRDGSAPFDVAQLSDGQRAALLMIATVLNSNPASVILLDEPERHLHRSISAPLIRELIRERPDCAFVISTHEIDLAVEFPDSRSLLLREYLAASDVSQDAWIFDVLEPNDVLSDELRVDILGARRKMLFVEGSRTSLDQPLYAILYPDVSVIAKGQSRSVMQSTIGLLNSSDHHWIDAHGLIDRDGRSTQAVNELLSQKIHALEVNAVEAIYYHENIIGRVAENQNSVTGASVADMQTAALAGAVSSISAHKARLCAQKVEAECREKIMASFPSRQDIEAGHPVENNFSTAELLSAEIELFDAAISASDYNTLICRYKIRETPALSAISSALRFVNKEDYQSAVRKLLLDNEDARQFVRSLMPSLSNVL